MLFWFKCTMKCEMNKSCMNRFLALLSLYKHFSKAKGSLDFDCKPQKYTYFYEEN